MNILGTVQRHENFQSKFVASRNVDVWLPPDYVKDERYPVLYMHDGQNLFEPISSIGGIAWETYARDAVDVLDGDLLHHRLQLRPAHHDRRSCGRPGGRTA